MNQSQSARRFMTKECADMLTGKTPSPYLRMHDPAQRMLVECRAEVREGPPHDTAYADRMIHFWRELSLAGMPRSGRGMDECFALLFESTFDLAEAEPEWALECLEQKPRSQWPWEALLHLARANIGNPISHDGLVKGFASLYAPFREQDDKWLDECCVVTGGIGWFWTAILCAAGVPEDHKHRDFRCALSVSSSSGWDDGRLHTRLIREAPQRAENTPKLDLMDHPIIRIARLKYAEGSIEQTVVDRFLNHRCIIEGFQSENDYFGSDLGLGQWLRDARMWATALLRKDPETCEAMFEATGETALEVVRQLFRTEVGSRPEEVDDLDATTRLMRWARRRRGFEYSSYRAQLWEFVVEIVDAALWLGWLFPQERRVLHLLEYPNINQAI